MRIVVVALAWTLIAAAVTVTAGEPEEQVLGGGLTIGTATPIAALLAAPQNHAGKPVRIEGVITEVCARHGDWIKVAGPRSGSGVLVRVDGDGFSFPSDCRARFISVEGVFEAGDGETAAVGDELHERGDGPHVCAAMTRGGVRFVLRASGAVVR